MPNVTGKTSYFWDRLKVSIWFVPLIMSFGAMVLAFFMLQIDVRFGHIPWSWARVVRIDAEGVRQVVAVITGAMMTITGVVFSVSVVTLALASNQFGPKILRNYLRDSGNKFVLGLFVATFIYGLFILSAVDTQQGGFVPMWSMIVSLALTVLAVGALIYYVHHISTAVQADHIIALIGEELSDAIDNILIPVEQDNNPSSARCRQEWLLQKKGLVATAICSPGNGYIQTIGYTGLADFASRQEWFVEINKRAGHFVLTGSVIGTCYASEKVPHDELIKLLDMIVFGRQRTPVQDIEFTMAQLVQIALRALSPGINDSLTGITCIDWLSVALGHMAGCVFPSYCFRDDDNVLRVVTHGFSFDGAVNAVFDPLRQSARGNEMVTIRLLEALQNILEVAVRNDYRTTLLAQAELIHKAAIESIPSASDRKKVTDSFARCKSISKRSKSG